MSLIVDFANGLVVLAASPILVAHALYRASLAEASILRAEKEAALISARQTLVTYYLGYKYLITMRHSRDFFACFASVEML